MIEMIEMIEMIDKYIGSTSFVLKLTGNQVE